MERRRPRSALLRVGDGDLDLHAGLDADGGDLLDDLGGGVQVDDPLVDAHLEAVPRLRALSAGGLPGRDPGRTEHVSNGWTPFSSPTKLI